MTPTEIMNRVVGDIYPVGDAGRDPILFDNLKQMCETVGELVEKIRLVSEERKAQQYSIKQAGVFAHEFLQELKDSIS